MIIFRSRMYRYATHCIGFLLLCFCQSTVLRSQTISGVVNIYSEVLDIDTCMNQVLLADKTGFSAGDRVLLIQMKGSLIDLSNTAAFGTVTAYGNAGNYEFGDIAAIQGLRITLKNKIVRLYDAASGFVQIVRVPQYVNPTIGSKVTARKWDGSRGGIVVFEASGNVTLNADIDVTGMGFRGGNKNQNTEVPDQVDFFYSLFSNLAGEKGEGIAKATVGFECGRGAHANGGGGGNNQNAGGGGGSNGGNGGNGGDQTDRFTRIINGGLGGIIIDYSQVGNRIFFGGGGGAGQENDSRGTDGGFGGGIVIIRANSLTGGAGRVIADGDSAKEAGADGAGGGGAGGTIVLDVNSLTNNPSLLARGGKGGNNNADSISVPAWCYAPGGGGSGGRIVVKGPSIPPSTVTGGKAGIVSWPNLPCSGASYGANKGDPGGGTWNNIITDEGVPFTYPKISIPRETICEGDTIQLNLPGAHGYKWSPSTGLDNDAISNPKASPGITTHYSVSYLDDRNCSFLDTVLVVVNPKPKPVIAGSLIVCAGQPFSYTITPVPGAAAQWTVVGGTIISGQGTETIGIQWGNGSSGIIEVDLADTVTSCTGKAILTVTISPAISPTITGARAICDGDTLTLSATAGFATYQWSNGDSLQSYIKVTAKGDYWVKAISAGGCTTYSDTVTIVVHPVPKVNIIASTLIMSDTGGIDTLTLDGQFDFYKWGTGETTDTLFATDSGYYNISVIDSNGCTARAQIHITRDISPPKITVAFDTLEAAPCDLVSFPLRIIWSQNMPPSGATDYTVEITFDESLLAPVDKSISSSINGRWRTLTLHGIRPDNQVDGVLPGIDFVAALGDTIATVITIETFDFINGKKVLVTKYNGLFKLIKLCKEGGTRLFAASDSLILRQNIPNPAQTSTTIKYSLLEEGISKLWVTDILGRKVMTLLDDYVKPGEYIARLNTSSLSDGNYFYILQTPTSVKRRMMRIER